MMVHIDWTRRRTPELELSSHTRESAKRNRKSNFLSSVTKWSDFFSGLDIAGKGCKVALIWVTVVFFTERRASLRNATNDATLIPFCKF